MDMLVILKLDGWADFVWKINEFQILHNKTV